jgi:hypothetical protein
MVMKEKIDRPKPNRIILLFGWWLVQVFIWAAIIPIVAPGGPPLPLWYWIVFIAVLVIQTFFLWKLLTSNYPEKRKNNFWMIGLMPLLIFFGLWISFLIEGIFTGLAGGR